MKIDHSSSHYNEEIEISDLDVPSRRMQGHKRYVDFFLRARRPLITTLIALAALSLIALLIPLVLPALPDQSAQHSDSLSTTNNTQTPSLLGIAQNIICISGETPGTFYGLHSDNGTPAWHYRATRTLLAAPMLANNALYLLTQQNGAMQILTLNMRNGAIFWKSSLPMASPSSLSAQENILYITSQDGMLYAVDANSGHLLWSKQFPPNPFIQILNGTVYVYVNDMAPLTSLWALQSTHGTLLWQVHETTFSRIIANNSGVTLLQTEDRAVEALRTSDGHVLWSQPVYVDANSPVIADSQAAYLNTDGGQLTAINILNGKVLWRVPQKYTLQGTLLLSHALIYLASIDDTIYTFHTHDGSPVWQANMHQIINGAMTITNNRLYVHSNDGLEHTLDATTGILLWTSFIGQPASYQHISTANTYAQSVQTTPFLVYITEQNGMLNALRYTDGKILWTRQITDQPQLLNDNFYAITPGGTVALLNAANGHDRWSFNVEK